MSEDLKGLGEISGLPKRKKKREKFRPSRRPYSRVLTEIIGDPQTHARSACYLSFVRWMEEHDKNAKPPTWAEFFGPRGDSDEDANKFAEAAKLPLPEIPSR